MKRSLLTLIFGILTAFGTWYVVKPQSSSKPLAFATPSQDLQRVTSPGNKLTLKVGTLINPAKPLKPFTLKTTHNNVLSEKSLRKQWTLLFFGYAACPSICPAALKQIQAVFEGFEQTTESNKCQFIFVSLNPEEDSIEKLQKFLSLFHPSFIGATGDKKEMLKLAESCRIYHWQDNTKNTGAKIIDHSASLILINPEGRLQALFSPPLEPQNIMLDLITLFASRAS